MNLLANLKLLLISLLPALILLGLHRSSSDLRKKTNPLVALSCFFLGMVSGAVAFFVFEGMSCLPGLQVLDNPLILPINLRVQISLIIIGPWEELLKIAPIVFLYTSKELPLTPVDAIIDAASAGLGFGAVENWYAMFNTGSADFGRMFVVPFIHMLLSGIVGRGLAISLEKKSTLPLIAGVLEAIVVHGFYDTAQMGGTLLHYIFLPVVLVLYYLFTKDLHRHARLSSLHSR